MASTYDLICEVDHYVVIVVHAGVIDVLEDFRTIEQATQEAEKLWKACDPETDDVKVMRVGYPDTYYWEPSK